MLTKHFLKTVLIFMGMIALGLLGIFLVSYFDQKGGMNEKSPDKSNNKTQVAK